MKKIVAIDPSLNNIGIAWTIDSGQNLHWQAFHPLYLPKVDKATRLEWVGHSLVKKLEQLRITDADILVIEYPNFQTSVRGAIAAEKGYTIDLGFLAGYLTRAFSSADVYMPTPIEWKGQQPKEAIGKKFTKWTGVDYNTVSDHEYEAVMMIKWIKEKLKL